MRKDVLRTPVGLIRINIEENGKTWYCMTDVVTATVGTMTNKTTYNKHKIKAGETDEQQFAFNRVFQMAADLEGVKSMLSNVQSLSNSRRTIAYPKAKTLLDWFEANEKPTKTDEKAPLAVDAGDNSKLGEKEGEGI